ncbi:MAG: hypothetical protein QOE36_1198, partial [Gaiellaceae bacterium]|nr:hypothetical protein [Gaiellaceae bacterium]
STGHIAGSGTTAAVALVAGIATGSMAWFTLLSAAGALGRRRLGPRALAAVDVGSGLALLGFAGALGVRTIRGAG